MIKLQDMTPSVYYDQSRDFQFIGRLYDIVLNAVKTNADTLYHNPLSDNSDYRLIDLMTMTLGFKSRHNYNIKQLTALCSAFAIVIRNKGNIRAIELAGNALLNAEGITSSLGVNISDDMLSVTIYVPQELSDLNLLKDLLTYILPAGMSCELIREFRVKTEAKTEVGITSTIDKYTVEIDDQDNWKQTSMVTKIADEETLENVRSAIGKDDIGLMANAIVIRPDEFITPAGPAQPEQTETEDQPQPDEGE